VKVSISTVFELITLNSESELMSVSASSTSLKPSDDHLLYPAVSKPSPSTSGFTVLLALPETKLFLLPLHLEAARRHLLDNNSDETHRGNAILMHSPSSNLSNRASVDAERTLNFPFLPLLPLLDKPAQTDE